MQLKLEFHRNKDVGMGYVTTFIFHYLLSFIRKCTNFLLHENSAGIIIYNNMHKVEQKM